VSAVGLFQICAANDRGAPSKLTAISARDAHADRMDDRLQRSFTSIVSWGFGSRSRRASIAMGDLSDRGGGV
jgi:hypothetical protein